MNISAQVETYDKQGATTNVSLEVLTPPAEMPNASEFVVLRLGDAAVAVKIKVLNKAIRYATVG